MAIETKTAAERLYFCIAEEVTQTEIPPFAQRAVGPLYEALKTAGLEIAGDLELICPQWNGEGKSRVIFAIPIPSDRPASRDPAATMAAPSIAPPYFLWQAPAFKCAWIDHVGTMPSLKSAWAAFGPSVQAAGLTSASTHGWREVYKHWESFHSEKNVTELQLEIQ